MKRKDLFIAISFANLLFFNFWSIVVYFTPDNSFYLKYIPTVKTYLAFIISELIVGFIIWLGIKLVRYLNNSFLSKTMKVIFTLFVLNFCYEVIWPFAKKIEPRILRNVPIILFITILIYLLVKRKTIQTAARVVLFLTPFVLFVFGQAVWMMININKIAQPVLTTNPPLVRQDQNRPRVLWLLFDEMDQRLTFVDRPKNLKLPELDRFKQEALFAENAYQAGTCTNDSVPSLFTGKIVRKSKSLDFNEMLITFRGSKTPEKWSQAPDIFSEMEKMGINTAIVGPAFPYPRILGYKVNHCEWYDDYKVLSPAATIWQDIYNIISLLFPSDRIRRSQETEAKIFREAQNLVVDPQYGLVFLHFDIPHSPFRNNKWSLWNNTPRGYLGNLELVDQSLGQLRKLLEEKGLWEQTTILIMADHHWRQSSRLNFKKMDPRVPFIIKLAGEKTGTVFQPSFNTALSRNLLMAIFQKQIGANADLLKWLNEHQHDYPLK